MTDDERSELGLAARGETRYVVDQEAPAIRWFWRALSLLLLAGVGFLWARLGDVDGTVHDLDAGVDRLMDEVTLNRAHMCRVLYAQGELEADGPCYDPPIYDLWREYALAIDAGR